jgi:hypothetical protein
MPLVIKSGLTQFVTDVTQYFTAELGAAAPLVACGWKERAKQTNQGPGRANRVVVLPGGLTGAGGKLVAVRRPGRRPIGNPLASEGEVHALLEWDRLVGLSIWAYDGADARSEIVQAAAAEALFEWVIRAVHASVFAAAIWSDVQWTIPTENSFGQELLVGLLIRTPLFAVPTETAFPEPDIEKGPPPDDEDEDEEDEEP